MFKATLLSTALCATCFATSLAAADYEVVVVEDGFFPEITYLNPGDTVTFINMSDSSITTKAIDNTWTTGELGIEASFLLSITEETHLNFADASNPEKFGTFSFEPAPLN